MTLFGDTLALFDRESIPCALIGASALAVRGIPRSTYDIDLLTTSPRVLDASLWESLAAKGVGVDMRVGDRADPLRGVIRLQHGTDRDVDIVVGRYKWQGDAIARAIRNRVLGLEIPVVLKSDLILLKLFAGGHQDLWDIEQLLADGDQDVRAEVDAKISDLPDDCQSRWTSMRQRE